MTEIENITLSYLDIIKELKKINRELIESENIELLQINERTISFLDRRVKELDKIRLN